MWNKNLFLLFLIDIIDKFVQNTNNAFNYICLYAFVCLYVSDMNDSNDIRNGREELGLFCYKVLTPSSAIWTWISCKCMQTLRPPLTNFKYKQYPKERKWSHRKCSIKTTKARKRQK